MPADSAGSTSRGTNPIKSLGKPTMSNRISNRQEDDSQRRTHPPPKAWGSGVNPITQRANTPSQANGSVKPIAKAVNSDAASSNVEDNDFRQVQQLNHSMGFYCTFMTKDGSGYVGIPTASKGRQPDIQFIFQNTRKAVDADWEKPQRNAAKPQFVGEGAQHVLTIPQSQIAMVVSSDAAGSVRPAQGKGFMTDVEISGNGPLRERKLERWQAPTDTAMTFGDSSHSGDFDQFKVNEQKFGVKSTYNEEDYTTHIDRNSANYAARSARAAKIAAEISGDTGSNAWSEQRGVNDEGYDEEDLYSGVRRDPNPLQSGQPNRYVPPSRWSQPGISKEAVVDPAILSAQVAQTDRVSASSGKAADITTQKPTQNMDKPAAVAKTPTDVSATSTTSVKKSVTPASIPAQQQPGVASKAPAEVHAAFQQFAKLEKMKVQNSRHMKNQQDKAVKVNDLKKFALNFKLHTPVPKDLLPILAKDEAKQNEIVKKAQEQAEQNKKDAAAQKQRPVLEANNIKRQSESAASGVQAQKTPQQTPGGPSAPNTLSQRLESNRRQHQQHNKAAGVAPAALPIHERQGRQASFTPGMPPITSPTKSGNPRGPPSGTSLKFNPHVTEFRPNPMAAQFKPASSVGGTTAVSSPSSHPVTRTITPVTGPVVSLFREAKARDQKGVPRKPITWQLESLRIVKPRGDDDAKVDGQGDATKEPAPATIQQPFKQKVDWASTENIDELNKLPKYKDQFVREAQGRPHYSAASPNHAARGPPHVQYPAQNGAPNMHHLPMPGQIPMSNMPGQPPYFAQSGHYDEHQMRPSSMQSAYPGPSPRMHSAYPTPMPPGAQMSYSQGPYMNPPHGMPPRQYSNGPQGVPGPHMQPQMMMPQGPGGPFMQQPMMPMQPQPHPQHYVPPVYGGPSQANGYGSPNRGAPAMMHSGSHQGHPQTFTPNAQYAQPYHPQQGQMVPRGSYSGQPNFPQSPYQQQPYPARTPSHGYAQPHQQQAMMTPQSIPAQPAMAGHDESK